MKAILAVTCIFSAVVLISAALPKEVCEAPLGTPSCGSGADLGDFYYYNRDTRKCEKEFTCAAPRFFRTEGECRGQCPYGEFLVCPNLYSATL
uniref:Putative salivary kunitz domain protein n=1 Tax=Ixodes ricinus TaxID=34613 RepID=A0A0K8R2N7_IXORI